MIKFATWLPIVVLCSLKGLSSAQGAEFIPLSHLSGSGYYYSEAHGVTPDGKTVVGRSNSGGGVEAILWQDQIGLVSLGDLEGGDFFAEAHDVSADGSVVIGLGTLGEFALDNAFRWTSATGMNPLGPVPAPGEFRPVTFALDISADGTKTVGVLLESTGEAVIWHENGSIERLGFLSESQFRSSYATSISADGSVVVGFGSYPQITDPSMVKEEAFRWTVATGMVGLGNLEGDPDLWSSAKAISPDGTTIVGNSQSYSTTSSVPVRWNEQGEILALGTFPGALAFPTAVSNHGRSIVGSERLLNAPGNQYVAWIWDPLNGVRELQDVLETEYSLDLTGWHLEAANDISPGGRFIVGRGINPDGNTEAWLVRLDRPIYVPEPATIALMLFTCVSFANRRLTSAATPRCY